MRYGICVLAISLLFVITYSYTVNVDELPSFFDDDDDEEMSRPEFESFMEQFETDYGYNGTLDTIRQTDLRHSRDAVYLDYTGTGMYRDSQIRECERLLVDHLYGNAHSRSPSSIGTENEVRLIEGSSLDGESSCESAALLQCRPRGVHGRLYQWRHRSAPHDW